ncbi:DUF6516 family protein [Fodinisporobacter ferrooxydans]|uniref:DUF6516 family protein n=1 Tax=Fodinisporobacter ferrooxydans TaxID=2901836 RepID=A0ABY4CMC2_9BACL|nr:DUF6516 family protein [Alicyclobacillaceae bacterium MYW30-H2]
MSLPPSNFTFLLKEFGDIIYNIKDGDGTGQKSSISFQRKTIRFMDDSKLYITERLLARNNGFYIDFYYYDWVAKNEKEILKFHSEVHLNPAYQTATEPYHVHPAKHLILHGKDRLPNSQHQDLYSILEFIRFHLLAIKAITD